MEISLMLMKQVAMMLLLLVVGYGCYHKGWINEEGSKQLSTLLLQVVMPVLIIVSYQIEFSTEKFYELLIAFVLSMASIAIAILVSSLFYKNNQPVWMFAAVFPNAGYFAIPIVQATFGPSAVFYLSTYLMCFTVCLWTYGVYLMSQGRTALSFKQAFVNPGLVGVVLGLLVFFSPLKLPIVISAALQQIANLNTPLAMIVFGVFIAQVELKTIFNELTLWKMVLVRLWVIPFVLVLAFKFVPSTYHIIKVSILIVSSAPVAISTTMFARKFDQDHLLATKIVGITTLCSIISIPCIVLIAQILW